MAKEQNIKRVLFCSSFTPPVNAGGGKNAYNFAKFLSKKDFEVTLLSLNRKGKLKRRERTNGLKIVRILYFNYNLLTKVLSLLIILPGYFYHILKNQFVLVYGGNIIGFEFIILLGRLLGKTVVFRSTMFGEDDLETLIVRRFAGRIRKQIMQGINIYFSMNPAFTKSWFEVYKARDKVFESVQGVNVNNFFPVSIKHKQELKGKLGFPTDKLIIITVGYLVKRKGFKEIFESLTKLKIPFHYVVVGNYSVPDYHYLVHINPEMKQLFDMGENILGSNVSFTGPVENVNEYLQAADIFLLNSRREGFPNALLEAMACGLPGIIREIPGIYDGVLTHGENALFPKDFENISECITNIHNQPELRVRIEQNALDTINNHASFEMVYNKLFNKISNR